MSDKNIDPEKIPPRWLQCPRKGRLIIGKLLPFKTPLKSFYNLQVPEESRFNVEMLLSSLENMKVKLGLVVDLTNTTRFYDKDEVEEKGSRYIKILCRGHGATPTEEQTETFVKLVDNFIRKKPLEAIGVHCTHGFNRTGFLIIAYLVEKCDWSIEAAVQMFANCRPPGIYKQEYLEELFRRYGDIEDAPTAPALPSWCSESDDTVDDDGHQTNGHQKRKRREFEKKNAIFMDGLVAGVPPVTNAQTLNSIRTKIQKMCNWEGNGFPGSQPVSMTKENIRLLKDEFYKVSWKADGIRYMMLIDGLDQVFMIDRDNAVYKADKLKFVHRKNLQQPLTRTLLDGEMIMDKVKNVDKASYLIYDIIKFEGIDVGNTDFARRTLCIEKEIVGPRTEAVQKGLLDKSKEPFRVSMKEFWDLRQCRKILEGDKFRSGLAHETDGLVFQPAGKDKKYHPGRCDSLLKWKPPSLNSIDFKLQVVVQEKLGCLRETVGNLFVGGQDIPIDTIKVNKQLKQYDGKIIECCWEPKGPTQKSGGKWVFMRERTDKSFPNSFTTAKAVMDSIQNPVDKAYLYNMIDNYAFQPAQDSKFKVPNGMPLKRSRVS